MRGDEVDAGVRPTASALVEVAAARQSKREVVNLPRVAAPERAHVVAVDAVPLGPEQRKVADLVAALAQVPRLGDELDLREHRVLVDDVEEGSEAVNLVQLARERRGEVEAEAV